MERAWYDTVEMEVEMEGSEDLALSDREEMRRLGRARTT
jgi:hypothetical protein